MSAVSKIPGASSVSSSSSFSEDDDDSRADPDYTSESEIEQIHKIKKKFFLSYYETFQVPEYKESSIHKEQCLSFNNNANDLSLDKEDRTVTSINARVNITEG